MARTKLDAMNICLRGIGIAPVETEDDTDLDAATASQVIDNVSTDIQSRGWWFNKEYNVKISPEAITGYVSAPPSALSIVTSGGSRNEGLVIRGDKIYDLWYHTYDLSVRAISDAGSVTTYIEFAYVTELDYNDLPPVAKMAIAYTARRQFAQNLEVDVNRWKFQTYDEDRAMTAMLREDARSTKRNTLTDNSVMATFLNNVGGVNSASSFIGVFPKRVT